MASMWQLLEIRWLLWIWLWAATIHCWTLPWSCLEGGVCGPSRDTTLHRVQILYLQRLGSLNSKGWNPTKKVFSKVQWLERTPCRVWLHFCCTTVNNQSRALPSGHRDLNSAKRNKLHSNMRTHVKVSGAFEVIMSKSELNH